MNWQDRIHESLTETRASKKTQKSTKKSTKKVTSKKGGRKVELDGPRYGEKSKLAIMDPYNDQHLNRIGTKDE